MKRVFSTLALLLCLSVMSPVAHADDPNYRSMSLPELTQRAEEGDAEAQTNLGFMYAEGQSVPQDFQEAARWWRKAADKGHVAAQFSLGSMYDNGEGVGQDLRQAVHWYHKAAGQGFAPALFNLGNMYENGEGVPQDIVLAYAFLSLAAAGGNNDAVVARDIVAERMSSAQIEEGKAIVSQWRIGKSLPTNSKTGRMNLSQKRAK
ncbi:MAG: sel1 repeat family protein [Betaproteobacteria bacterium]|nr:sel1 repeat family protein [Betaproteobacteria bacterium]